MRNKKLGEKSETIVVSRLCPLLYEALKILVRDSNTVVAFFRTKTRKGFAPLNIRVTASIESRSKQVDYADADPGKIKR